jgi:hypothetical protein
MNEVQTAEEYKRLLSDFLKKGFVFEYLYQKGGDSYCVYVFRFKKGKSFFDLREVSGGNELNFVVYTDGAYTFPSLKNAFPKAYRQFAIRHLFKRPSAEERRAFIAGLLREALANSTADFFGITL